MLAIKNETNQYIYIYKIIYIYIPKTFLGWNSLCWVSAFVYLPKGLDRSLLDPYKTSIYHHLCKMMRCVHSNAEKCTCLLLFYVCLGSKDCYHVFTNQVTFPTRYWWWWTFQIDWIRFSIELFNYYITFFIIEFRP